MRHKILRNELHSSARVLRNLTPRFQRHFHQSNKSPSGHPPLDDDVFLSSYQRPSMAWSHLCFVAQSATNAESRCRTPPRSILNSFQSHRAESATTITVAPTGAWPSNRQPHRSCRAESPSSVNQFQHRHCPVQTAVFPAEETILPAFLTLSSISHPAFGH
jgi:hypothetical protein